MRRGREEEVEKGVERGRRGGEEEEEEEGNNFSTLTYDIT
jgi:flagellar biosynthesis/type III secretory pathway protein FliH